jgi:hypothetical protein
LCSQLYRGTRENVIVRFAVEALADRAAQRLAATVERPEPPEASELRRSIAALSALGDPELAGVIELKQQRLELLLVRPELDPGLVRNISDVKWFSSLEEEELREILQAFVERVVVTRQVPTAIRLRL